jgi:hypothetical protein
MNQRKRTLQGDMSDLMDELDAITAVMQMYVDGAAQAEGASCHRLL